MTPEQQARREIDAKLVAAGWLVQDRRHQLNLHAGPGVALCETDVEGEDHLFLDPIKRKDVLLVTYAPDGSMQPRPKVTAWEEKRVRRTAECFGLNDFPNLTDARRQVWQDCQLLVDAVFNNLRESEKCGGSPALEAVAESKLEELRKMIRESVPFSSVAMACIEGNDPALLKILI